MHIKAGVHCTGLPGMLQKERGRAGPGILKSLDKP